jgi:hypothetical protein
MSYNYIQENILNHDVRLLGGGAGTSFIQEGVSMSLDILIKTRVKKLLFVNMYDIESEILEDFLIRWGYVVEKTTLEDFENFLITGNEYVDIAFQFLQFNDREFSALGKILAVVPPEHLVITAPFYFPKYIERLRNQGIERFLIQPYSPLEAERAFS